MCSSGRRRRHTAKQRSARLQATRRLVIGAQSLLAPSLSTTVPTACASCAASSDRTPAARGLEPFQALRCCIRAPAALLCALPGLAVVLFAAQWSQGGRALSLRAVERQACLRDRTARRPLVRGRMGDVPPHATATAGDSCTSQTARIRSAAPAVSAQRHIRTYLPRAAPRPISAHASARLRSGLPQDPRRRGRVRVPCRIDKTIFRVPEHPVASCVSPL